MTQIISDTMYAIICDAIERASMHLPVNSAPRKTYLHTSDYARRAANKILEELETEVKGKIYDFRNL